MNASKLNRRPIPSTSNHPNSGCPILTTALSPLGWASSEARPDITAAPWLASTLVAAMLFAGTALHAQQQQQQNYDPAYANSPQAAQDAQQLGQLVDPPSRVARLSVLQGNVSFQAAAAPDFAAAEINYPLTSGDRLYTDSGSRAELEAGQLTLRLGATADATVTSLTDDIAQFGLAQGSAHLRAYALAPNTTTEIDTPNASIAVLAPGDYRVDVYPQSQGQPGVTVVTVFSGQVQVNADGVQQTLNSGQSFQVSGVGYNGNPAQAQLVRRARPDELDQFSFQRDALYQQQFAQNSENVNPDTIGYADLGQYGDWAEAPAPDGDGSGPVNADYGGGPVWFPRNVAVDWQPYSVGHWAYISPWGWTWVESEPWGFAPFHYGRWARFGPRWGWIPGPPVIHPVYSPALVVFVGGANFHIAIGHGGDIGVAAWFPLGPREVYQPPYRTGPGYINRINVTNIYARNTVEVRNIYNNRTVNVYQGGGPGHGPAGSPSAQYVNRSIATVAVPQDKFAGGRPVTANAIHVDPHQFANAPINNRPPAGAQHPGPNPVGPGNQPRALPPVQSRPVLANQGPAAVQNHRDPAPGNQAPGNRGGFNRVTAPSAPPAPAPAPPAPAQPTRQPAAPSSAPIERPAPPAPTAPANNNYRQGPYQAPRPQQPEPVTRPTPSPAPSTTAPPVNNNHREGPVEAPRPQPVPQPAPQAPAAPVNNNNYRHGPVQAPAPTPAQPPAPARTPPPAPAPQQRPAPAARPAPQPAPQKPAPPAARDDRRPEDRK